MKVIVDPDVCEANGVCAGLEPGVFGLDDDDRLHILVSEVPADRVDGVRRAVQSCPKTALRVTE